MMDYKARPSIKVGEVTLTGFASLFGWGWVISQAIVFLSWVLVILEVLG
jgi:hypothetical protein